jgi:hypothetical protein
VLVRCCAAGDLVLCSAASGWVAPAVAKVDKKKKQKGKGEEGEQQQQQGGAADAELDPEKAAKKVREGMQLQLKRDTTVVALGCDGCVAPATVCTGCGVVSNQSTLNTAIASLVLVCRPGAVRIKSPAMARAVAVVSLQQATSQHPSSTSACSMHRVSLNLPLSLCSACGCDLACRLQSLLRRKPSL